MLLQIQWNLSKLNNLEMEVKVQFRDVSSFERFKSVHTATIEGKTLETSSLERVWFIEVSL
jgi:hypothetical protein